VFWELQKAKEKFDHLINDTQLIGPQIIRSGEKEAVALPCRITLPFANKTTVPRISCLTAKDRQF
jgi:hypothetical protein